MPRLTHALIRKKSEHNEGVLGDLEEISLHQLEIEKIEAIGDCKKLKILYLQNNIINRIENIAKLKDLEYLNLALNNIRRIEGLRRCEFLNKLDLTVNFVDVHVFAESIRELKYNKHLKELFMLGNPAMDWEGGTPFVIATLPQLTHLDGNKISRSQRIRATQNLPQLTQTLERLAVAKRRELRDAPPPLPIDRDDETAGEYTPESRTDMYREVAEEKTEKSDREKEMRPRERNAEKEHVESFKQEKEAHGATAEPAKIRQCNQAGFHFVLDEDRDNIFFRVDLPKNMSTSLIDVDVHPTYVSVVVKNKVLRIKFPAEVQSDAGKAERSKTTGALQLTLPKVQKGSMLGLIGDRTAEDVYTLSTGNKGNATQSKSKPKKLAEQLLEASRASAKRAGESIRIDNIAQRSSEGASSTGTALMTARAPSVPVDADEPPPLE